MTHLVEHAEHDFLLDVWSHDARSVALRTGVPISPRHKNEYAIRRVGVVIPAHNEEKLVGDCLVAVSHVARAVSLPVTVMVVLDDCDDRTEAICRSFSVDTLSVVARSVGVARHVGVSTLLSGVTDLAAIWISNTDADTVVPLTWLRDQLTLAAAGADVVAGTVGLSHEDGHLGRRFKGRVRGGRQP